MVVQINKKPVGRIFMGQESEKVQRIVPQVLESPKLEITSIPHNPLHQTKRVIVDLTNRPIVLQPTRPARIILKLISVPPKKVTPARVVEKVQQIKGKGR
jgi:hypothetical protein